MEVSEEKVQYLENNLNIAIAVLTHEATGESGKTVALQALFDSVVAVASWRK